LVPGGEHERQGLVSRNEGGAVLLKDRPKQTFSCDWAQLGVAAGRKPGESGRIKQSFRCEGKREKRGFGRQGPEHKDLPGCAKRSRRTAERKRLRVKKMSAPWGLGGRETARSWKRAASPPGVDGYTQRPAGRKVVENESQ